VNPSDVFRFVLALILLPPVVRLVRMIRLPQWRRAFMYGVVFIIVGFGMQALAPLIPVDVRLLRHLVFAAGGFSLARAAWQARNHELAAAGGRP
jgi:hypothetical protein